MRGGDEETEGAGGQAAGAVRVVLMRPVPGSSLVVPLAGGSPVDLQAQEAALDDGILQSLLDSSLWVSTDEDVPAQAVQLLRRMPVPPLFASSAWLRRCRALVLDEGGTQLGTVRVLYRTGLGLRMDSADMTGE